jgi:hypothetical protein
MSYTTIPWDQCYKLLTAIINYVHIMRECSSLLFTSILFIYFRAMLGAYPYLALGPVHYNLLRP